MLRSKLSLIALAGFLTLMPALAPVTAKAAPGPVIVVRGGFFGPRWYGWYGPGWWGPYGWYGPGWYGPRPWWGSPYYYAPAAGKVKIATNQPNLKNALVYVDGSYAGPVAKLKKFPLPPGKHNIELRDYDGRTLYQQSVQVIAGKTVEIYPVAS